MFCMAMSSIPTLRLATDKSISGWDQECTSLPKFLCFRHNSCCIAMDLFTITSKSSPPSHVRYFHVLTVFVHATSYICHSSYHHSNRIEMVNFINYLCVGVRSTIPDCINNACNPVPQPDYFNLSLQSSI